MDHRDLQLLTREPRRSLAEAEQGKSSEAQPVSASMRIAGLLKDAAGLLGEAKDLANLNDEGELYVWLASRIGELDGTRNVLDEREGRDV